MRGEQRFKKDFETTSTNENGTGRSKDLILQRDTKLIHRYYYYGKFTLKRFEAILEQLKIEFDIEAYTIQERISKNHELISVLKEQQPSITFFRKMYPHINWPTQNED